MKSSVLLIGAFGALLVLLAAGLRPDAFFVGDSGIKLIAAKNAIARPDRPLDIPLPVIGQESLPYIEPFFEADGDHSHAVTTDLFPLVSAPLIRRFGLRGAYVLPATGFLGILIGCAWLAVALDARRSPALVILIAGSATPFLFYGLEFWEHAPSVALATLATAMIVEGLKRQPAPAASLALGAGLTLGLGILLRPETTWALVAVLAGSVALNAPSNRRWLIGGLVVLGAVIPLVPLEMYTLRHFGRVLPAHLIANAGLLPGNWIAERSHLVRTWYLPTGWALSGPLRPESFWVAAPLILLACVPIRRTASPQGRRFLWIVWGVTMVLVFLTAPNDGGGQWAPRYLLFAYVPLVIVASDVVGALPQRASTLIVLSALLLVCVWTQRVAYRDLRGTKSTYGRVVDFVDAEVAPGGYVVSDLWWLDQVAASAISDRRFLFVPDSASGHAVMERLSRAVVPIVIVIRSESESADVSAWREDTCYVEIKREAVDVRRLVAITLHHRCRA